jgi:hypothetical protein
MRAFYDYQQPFYEVWVSTNNGDRIALLDRAITFGYTKVNGAVGGFSVIVPDYYPDSFWRPDNTLQIWRSTEAGAIPKLASFGYMLKTTRKEHAGADVITIEGPDEMHLLGARVVVFSSTGEATFSGPCDDMMKKAVRRNLGDETFDTARDLTDWGLVVTDDASLGVDIDLRNSWGTVLDALREMHGVSANKPDDTTDEVHPVYFRLKATPSDTDITYRFETFVDRPGADRRLTSGKPAMFSREWGNLEKPVLSLDFTDSANYIYGLGNSEELYKFLQEAWVQKRLARLENAPIGRREKVRRIRKALAREGLLDGSRAAAHLVRPKFNFSAVIKDTPQAKYTIDWDFGDEVPCMFRGQTYDGIINGIAVAVTETGQEKVQAKVELNDVKGEVVDA